MSSQLHKHACQELTQLLNTVWKGSPQSWLPRGTLNQVLTRTQGLFEKSEGARRKLKVRMSRSRDPHKRLVFLIERAALKMHVLRRRVRTGNGQRDWLYSLKKY